MPLPGPPSRFHRCTAGILLAATTQAACISYTTGARGIEVPAERAAPPPRIHLALEGVPDPESCAAAFRASGLFAAIDAAPAGADAVVRVTGSRSGKVSWGFVVCACTFFLLPMPASTEEYSLRATIEVPPLAPTEPIAVDRTLRTWGGIALLPFSFLQASPDEMRREMAEEMARAVTKRHEELLQETWAETRASASPEQHERFLNAFPNSRYTDPARTALEDLLWHRVGSRGDAASYFRYLGTFPRGRHVVEARRRGAGPVWRELAARPDETSVERYLALFPDSPQRVDAIAALDDILWRAAEGAGDQADLYRAYLERLPDGSQAVAARDIVAWATAEDLGSPDAIRTYLRQHPDGKFATHAQQVLARLDVPDQAETSRILHEKVEDQIRKNFPVMGPDRRQGLRGALTYRDATVSMTLQFEANVIQDVLHYRITGGRVEYANRKYFCAADDEWYPCFERLFR